MARQVFALRTDMLQVCGAFLLLAYSSCVSRIASQRESTWLIGCIMFDLKYFRDNVEMIRERLAAKKFAVDLDAVIALDTARREGIHRAEALRARQKAANTAMAALEKGSPQFLEKVAEMKSLAAEVKELQ